MTGSGLQEYGGESPIWGFVRQLATERWTGEAEVGIDPRVELYVAEGSVYFAQKVDDAPLGARLVAVGALTAAQLRNGGVPLGTVAGQERVSLARLFQREPDVDRDLVELTVDRFAEQLLEQVAEHPVGTVSLHPLRHHPSGIHQWRRRESPAPTADDAATMSALVDAVVSLSGEVPVVRSTPTPTGVPSTPPAPVVVPAAPVQDLSPLHLAGPHESPMSFDPVVPAVHEPDPALPTLSSLPSLTPLPTLGAPAPTPAPAPAPAPVLPSLERPAMEPLPDRPTTDAPRVLHVPPAPAPTPAPAPVPTVTPAAPGAMMVAPTPGTNAAGAPPETEAETEEIWDMVDELLGLPHPAEPSAPPTAADKKSRGWLRGRKG